MAFDREESEYNYRFPNNNSALGAARVTRLDEHLGNKRLLSQRYFDGFDGFTSCEIFAEPEGARSNYFFELIMLAPDTDTVVLNVFLEELSRVGYLARPVWKLMHWLKFHADSPRAPLPVAEDLARRIISLPFSAMLAYRA